MAIPTLMQPLDRTVHASNDGIDIERKFYFEPYSSHPDVLAVFLGSVQGQAGEWTRNPPVHDPWIENCYCDEARVTFADAEVMTSTPSIMADGRDTIKKWVEDIKEQPALGTAGAILTAHYRPLITAWEYDEADEADDPQKPEFDWMDYESMPGIRQMPWPEGLYVNHKGASSHVPHTVGFPFTVPIATITIRRILVPEIPWDKIDAVAGCVNKEVWPPENSEVAKRLPSCPPRTCKFENAKVTNQIDTGGSRWYELTYTFTRINQYDRHLIAINGDDNPGPVTWNHIFARPSLWGWKGATAWYEVFKGEAQPIWAGPFGIDRPGVAVSQGRLHNECDFMPLFTI